MKGQSVAVLALALCVAAAVAVVDARAAMPTPSAPPMPPGQQPPAQEAQGGGWVDSGTSGGEAYTQETQPGLPPRAMYGADGRGQRMPGPANPPLSAGQPYFESAHRHTEVTYNSYASNVGGSFVGALFGVALVVVAHVLLWWNEGRTLRREAALAAAAEAVHELDAEQYSGTLDGALVHAVHRIETKEALEDVDAGLTGEHAIPAIKLVRRVEMYQWVQKSSSRTESQVGGGSRTVTTYSYEKEWRSDVLNSGAYKNPPFPSNPPQKPLQNLTKMARNVSFGAYQLSAAQVEGLSAQESVALPQHVVAAALRERVGAPVSVAGSTVYVGDAAAPKIGDVRIEYKAATAQMVSVLAQLQGRSFGPYRPAGAQGESVDLLTPGTHTAAAMIASEQSSNTLLKWGLRVVGFFVMWFGLSLTAGPLTAIANVLPFLGSIVGAISGGLTFLVCIPLTLLTIAVAWIYYRPKVGAALLVAALIAFYFVHIAAVSAGAGAAAYQPVAAAAAVHAAGAAVNAGASAGACYAQQKAFDDCTSHNNGQLAACQYYFDQLTVCKKR